MKKLIPVFLLLLTLCMTGCMSYKKVPYIKNSDTVDLSPATYLYDAKIKPKDYLTITVNLPKDPDAVRMFNLMISSSAATSATSGRTNMSSQYAIQGYNVENDGTIDFPLLGKIHVVGMTRLELQDYIIKQIYPKYVLEEPIVLVTISSFKISVLGEVNGPGQYTISNGKVNLFEAIALARDLTIYGRRDNVKLIRESSTGEKMIVELNLNDANIINSPYYQLQQDDILYVTPNKVRAKGAGIGAETSLYFSTFSILMTLTNLLISVLK